MKQYLHFFYLLKVQTMFSSHTLIFLSVVYFSCTLLVVHAPHFGYRYFRQPTTLLHMQSQALDLLSSALPSLQASTWCHLSKVPPSIT